MYKKTHPTKTVT